MSPTPWARYHLLRSSHSLRCGLLICRPFHGLIGCTLATLAMELDKGLARLNALGDAEAEGELLKCCGSTSWARRLAARRPFGNVDELFTAAEQIWGSLGEEDWLEAFSAQPPIGGRRAERLQDA